VRRLVLIVCNNISSRLVDWLLGGGRAGLLISKLWVLDDTEESIHLLEGDTLGLRDEEPDEDEHGEAEGAEDEVGSVSGLSDVDQHAGNGLGDDEVEEPLGGSGDGDVHGTETSGGDFGDKNPADGTPTELEDGGKEENA